MIEELDRVVLTRDLPEKKLKAGDVGTVVAVYKGGEDGVHDPRRRELRARNLALRSGSRPPAARKLRMPARWHKQCSHAYFQV